MSIKGNYISIADPEQDILEIQELILITGKGIESITMMYDDHTLDRNASEKMLALQDNFMYRVNAVLNQYLFLIGHLDARSVIDTEKHPAHFAVNHPLIYMYQNELSSMLDSILFHLCSAFDYLGHYISYMFVDNKNRTIDWDSLAKTCRAKFKGKFSFSQAVQDIDSGLRANLEQYRSKLIHKQRDYHPTNVEQILGSKILNLSFAVSHDVLRIFRKNFKEYLPENNYSLDWFASRLIRLCLANINFVLQYLRNDLLVNSKFVENVKNPKTILGFTVLKQDSDTNEVRPVSDFTWQDYIVEFTKFQHSII